MRRPRYLDFTCPTCETAHTRFVETNDDDTPIEPEVCNENSQNYDGVTCGGVLVQNEMAAFQGYTKVITRGNHDYNDRERERLEKRGDEHWKKHGKDEAIDRERALFKKMGMAGTGGVR